jgi:excisionase family DNA binding protein
MISIAQAATILGLSRQRVALLAKQRRIRGARLVGRTWRLPEALHVLPGRVRGPGKPKSR